MPEYPCKKCGRVFTKPSYLARHEQRVYPCDLAKQQGAPTCSKCGRRFTQMTNMYRHRKTCAAPAPAPEPSMAEQLAELQAKMEEMGTMLVAAMSKQVVPAGGAAPSGALVVTDNSTTTSNVQNNIMISMVPINPYGKEVVPPEVWRQAMEAAPRDRLPQVAVRTQWGRKDLPQNNNVVCLPNQEPQVFTGKAWERRDKDKLYPDMLARSSRAVLEVFPIHTEIGHSLMLDLDESRFMCRQTEFAREVVHEQVTWATLALQQATGMKPGDPLPHEVPVHRAAAPAAAAAPAIVARD